VEGGGGLTSIFFQGTPDSLATALNEYFGGNVLTCQKNILPKIGVIFALCKIQFITFLVLIYGVKFVNQSIIFTHP